MSTVGVRIARQAQLLAAVVLGAFGFGVGLVLAVLLVGRPATAAFFLVPLVGGVMEAAMARFEGVRA